MEAFKAELAGLADAFTSGDYPESLTTVTFAERNPERARRINIRLQRLLPDGLLPLNMLLSRSTVDAGTQADLRTAGYGAASKPHIFVAMPFAAAMDDVFHYGIQGAANAAGFLCERADLSNFTGDVMDWVKRRIAGATLVVADLSSANPNVYLEVGYAWGCRVPTVLLVKDAAELTFDVRGHRCLVYKSIRQLEETLRSELQELSKTSTNAGGQREP